MIVNQIGGKGRMVKLNKKSTTNSQQTNSNRDAKIMEYNIRINALADELAELKDKEELCQSLKGRIDNAIGELYNARGKMTEIVANIDNALKATPISKNNIDGAKDIITNNVSSLMNNIVLLTEKSVEIQKRNRRKKRVNDLLN